MTIESEVAPNNLRARRLAHLVAAAVNADEAQVAEYYRLTAIVVQRPLTGAEKQTLVVELVDDRHNSDHRWSATAFDESSGVQTPLSHGQTAKAAIAGLEWSLLDPDRP